MKLGLKQTFEKHADKIFLGGVAILTALAFSFTCAVAYYTGGRSVDLEYSRKMNAEAQQIIAEMKEIQANFKKSLDTISP